MKNTCLTLLSIFLLVSCINDTGQPESQFVITTDIDNFWNAFDQITATSDSATQHQLLQELYLDKGTEGLEAIRQARRYIPEEYLYSINTFPEFWKAIRANTLKAKHLSAEIEGGVQKLKNLYPDLKPAKVYFTIGAFRTPGTTMDSLVLIGSELAMADEHIPTNEFPAYMGHLRAYFDSNPINEIVFLNVHEFVHTQQITTIGDNLLTQCLYEGVAEFVTVIAMEKESPTPAIAFGKQNEDAIKEAFMKEMFHYSYANWLWNNTDNQFQMRDLGYYVGYAIAEKYYEAAENKQQAIKDLIEIDYQSSEAVIGFVDQTGYFSGSIKEMWTDFENNRPEVVGIQEFENGSQKVDPGITQITLAFSEPMDSLSRGFEFGPLGQENVLSIQGFNGFSEDGKTASFGIQMESNKQYQVVISPRFRNLEGIPLKPFLIDIRTASHNQ